jgi:tetratricopeptide (TPR) repeat protein
MSRWTILLSVALMLAACGGSGQKNIIENPYAERMKELSRNGVIAMQRERWLPAQNLFERALEAAQLANDPVLIAQAWYNLGSLHLSSGSDDKGEVALHQAAEIAERHQLEKILLRTRIAQALIDQKRGENSWQPDTIGSSMPLDIHLSFARLAQLQGRYEVSRRAYDFVLSKRDTDRISLLYKINAHMGIALVAEQQGKHADALQEVKKVLTMSREVGAPRLAAHALMLEVKLVESELTQEEALEDALVIYQALGDRRGQKEALVQLIPIEERQGEVLQVETMRKQLRALEKR